MPYPAPIYLSNPAVWFPADAQSILWCSAPTLSSPIPSTPFPYVLTQKFMCRIEAFQPLPLNTPYPFGEYDGYVLVNESDKQDISGGCCEWTRTYALVPDSYQEPTNISYNFIGYYPGRAFTIENGVLLPGRPRQTITVPATIVYDFFGTGPGFSDASFADIPVIPAQSYITTAGPAPLDFIWNPGEGGLTFNSIPTTEEYQYWISTGQKIVAQDSILERWMGNIFRRQTIYIDPQ